VLDQPLNYDALEATGQIDMEQLRKLEKSHTSGRADQIALIHALVVNGLNVASELFTIFTDMKIFYGTKEQHKELKQKEFLALTPVERFYAFLRLSERIAEFPTKAETVKDSGNFVIQRRVKV
jgi:hypothetical protein